VNIIRNRIINFRVSEDEFRRLKAASTLQNARCLSDFARAATLRIAGSADGEVDRRNDNDLNSFDRRLATLEVNVARLVEALTPRRNGVNVAHVPAICQAAEVISCE
jgi:hypothetical protein